MCDPPSFAPACQQSRQNALVPMACQLVPKPVDGSREQHWLSELAIPHLMRTYTFYVQCTYKILQQLAHNGFLMNPFTKPMRDKQRIYYFKNHNYIQFLCAQI